MENPAQPSTADGSLSHSHDATSRITLAAAHLSTYSDSKKPNTYRNMDMQKLRRVSLRPLCCMPESYMRSTRVTDVSNPPGLDQRDISAEHQLLRTHYSTLEEPSRRFTPRLLLSPVNDPTRDQLSRAQLENRLRHVNSVLMGPKFDHKPESADVLLGRIIWQEEHRDLTQRLDAWFGKEFPVSQQGANMGLESASSASPCRCKRRTIENDGDVEFQKDVKKQEIGNGNSTHQTDKRSSLSKVEVQKLIRPRKKNTLEFFNTTLYKEYRHGQSVCRMPLDHPEFLLTDEFHDVKFLVVHYMENGTPKVSANPRLMTCTEDPIDWDAEKSAIQEWMNQLFLRKTKQHKKPNNAPFILQERLWLCDMVAAVKATGHSVTSLELNRLFNLRFEGSQWTAIDSEGREHITTRPTRTFRSFKSEFYRNSDVAKLRGGKEIAKSGKEKPDNGDEMAWTETQASPRMLALNHAAQEFS
ncbi:hypothetical protein K490DRAFT_60832 [Saccharata proteae CBS 121410]|uniref:Uncharacterized protein n=1 Tax=Saccharata proteae CBS 121410 TaxID=1314787 RepID=A0A9P4I1M5_9PEZI|nr:hypothetical protein K490DRAFT_60832 [Saccharata proteae CBS 121410]